MTTVKIPLGQNPELAALVADRAPGDWIALKASIKSKDDQTVEVRLEECDECEKPQTDEDASDEEADASEEPAAPAETPGKSLATKLTAEAAPEY